MAKMTKTLIIFGEDICQEYDGTYTEKTILFCDNDITKLISCMDTIFPKISYTMMGDLYERRVTHAYDEAYYCLTGEHEFDTLPRFSDFCVRILLELNKYDDAEAYKIFSKWVNKEKAQMARYKKAKQEKYDAEKALTDAKNAIIKRIRFIQTKIEYNEAITPEEADFVKKHSDFL